MSNVNRPVAPSAAAHAARIRARDEEWASASGERDTRQTYEIYGERAAAQARADEELREGARKRELRARGVWVPDDASEEEGDREEYDQAEEYEDEEPETDEEPVSTAERYAARERKRQQAERAATLAAHRGAVRTLGPQGHQQAAKLAQPHRYADRWQKPAS
ncbi:hypothetical protein AQI95_21170 [Streptomyces yokosukanensis]|uniref:Uncharacterized protein n=1 Tax=Streptomyces yokosukanensis TaxID=67386 RepID=A0A101P309_9ACTN|nr:hypothetical protein [Streptomyces yokosukanensis]KUN03953.1 hypothetical protein AQI95_21170 [Streptomyces yokosukanensis]